MAKSLTQEKSNQGNSCKLSVLSIQHGINLVCRWPDQLLWVQVTDAMYAEYLFLLLCRIESRKPSNIHHFRRNCASSALNDEKLRPQDNVFLQHPNGLVSSAFRWSLQIIP